MTPASTPQRLICTTCTRPFNACICRWIEPTIHRVEVLILQHPLEVNNAKGSARLLQLSLANSRLVTGEAFSEPALQALLTGPLGSGGEAQHPKRALLLYPRTPQDSARGMAAPPVPVSGLLDDPTQLRLIVLDGTWRKSRKMLYRNPLLQQLPRLALCDMPASHYLIRKAHGPDQLSTLEATCAALAQLEGSATPFAPLLHAFDGFVAQQLGFLKR